ncbi:hypothetical protein [Brevibacillus sp. SYSU BS000544]|uniref:hypothetical protein n=1 Tax=Brevibacillus sp. SYSU BS000544 TaxID=3416443 RepID=UPI003CE48519
MNAQDSFPVTHLLHFDCLKKIFTAKRKADSSDIHQPAKRSFQCGLATEDDQ